MPANRCPNPSCEYFNRPLPHNAQVCPWCSTPLGYVVSPTPGANRFSPPQPIPQRPVTPPDPGDYSREYPPRTPIPPIQPDNTPQIAKLPLLKLIHTSGREFQWSGEAGFIGRRSKSITIPPEIDLTGIPHEGILSRRHARVSWNWSQNTYMIVDMSTNGIYLNGTLLNPGVQYRLINGDSLQLGQDNLVIFAVYIM